MSVSPPVVEFRRDVVFAVRETEFQPLGRGRVPGLLEHEQDVLVDRISEESTAIDEGFDPGFGPDPRNGLAVLLAGNPFEQDAVAHIAIAGLLGLGLALAARIAGLARL